MINEYIVRGAFKKAKSEGRPLAMYMNEEGGVCSVAFIDCGHPQLVMFDYKYN